jgi:hypothetical protein
MIVQIYLRIGTERNTFWGSIFTKTISSAKACMYLIVFQVKGYHWKIKMELLMKGNNC